MLHPDLSQQGQLYTQNSWWSLVSPVLKEILLLLQKQNELLTFINNTGGLVHNVFALKLGVSGSLSLSCALSQYERS